MCMTKTQVFKKQDTGLHQSSPLDRITRKAPTVTYDGYVYDVVKSIPNKNTLLLNQLNRGNQLVN